MLVCLVGWIDRKTSIMRRGYQRYLAADYQSAVLFFQTSKKRSEMKKYGYEDIERRVPSLKLIKKLISTH